MSYRMIVIDPYERQIMELENEGDFREIQRLISNYRGDEPCSMFCTVNFGGSTVGYVDDSGNWTQFAWFSLVGDARLFCGRMVMQGSTFDGEVANLDADITTLSVLDKVIWLGDQGAIDKAQEYEDAMVDSAKHSDLPVISLDTGLVERIREAVQRKHEKRARRLEGRSYQSAADSDNPLIGTVTVYDRLELTRHELPKCLDHVNHSPDGFSWGYGGSGPAQLAYAILFDVTNDEDKTLALYQHYKFAVISRLGRKDWIITAASVLQWIAEVESKRSEVTKKA